MKGKIISGDEKNELLASRNPRGNRRQSLASQIREQLQELTPENGLVFDCPEDYGEEIKTRTPIYQAARHLGIQVVINKVKNKAGVHILLVTLVSN